MEQPGEKRKWVTPELVVLARSHPEEAVLMACKFFSPDGPGGNFSVCALITDCNTTCELGAPS